jgi:hypothetical protein
MKRLPAAALVAVFLFIGSLWCIWWRSQTTVTESTPPAAQPVTPRIAASSPTTVPTPAKVEALPEFGTEAFNKLAKERGAAWLAERNRDAVSLLALWDLTGDETVLREAAEKFPGNPQVCLAMLGLAFSGANQADQEKWTAALIAADPGNPLGYYYQARMQAAKGDSAGVMASLEKALEQKGRINSYLRERMMGVKEGLLASGVSLADTYQLSLTAPMMRATDGIHTPAKFQGVFKKELAKLQAPEHMEERQTLAALGLRLAEQQRLTESSTLMTDLIA